VISTNSSYLSNLAEHFNKYYANGGFFVPSAASESDAPMKKGRPPKGTAFLPVAP
jgi:hypothetical protein